MGKGCSTILAANGSNFSSWLRDIGDFLAQKKLYAYLSNPAPAGRNANTALEEDLQALGYLRQSCEETVKLKIAECRTTFNAVQLLRRQFHGPSEVRLATLEGEKARLTKYDDESIAAYFQRARSLRADIVAAGGRWDEPEMRIPIVKGLPDAYAITAEVVLLQPDRSLLALERQLTEKEELLRASASHPAFTGSVRPGGSAQHGSSGSFSHSGGSRGGSSDGCRYCGMPEHFVRSCPIREADINVGIYRDNIWVRPRSGDSKGGSSSRGRNGRGKGGGSSNQPSTQGGGPSRPTVF